MSFYHGMPQMPPLLSAGAQGEKFENKKSIQILLLDFFTFIEVSSYIGRANIQERISTLYIQTVLRRGGSSIFWGPKTSKAHMKVLHHTVSALFTVCQYLARCSRYDPSKFGCVGQNERYPYTFFIKKLCSK